MPSVLKPIRLSVALTWAGLLLERVWRAFWPVGTIALVFAAAWLMGWATFGVRVANVAGLCLFLGLLFFWRGLRGFSVPSQQDALDRIDATLVGRPITALTDEQALGGDDAASRALWQAHLSRMQARLSEAHPVAPRVRLASADPWGLRFVGVGLFAVAALFFRPEGAVVAPVAPPQTASVTATWEGWITPPRHTGRPVLYLADQTGEWINVPTGSEIAIRFYGNDGQLTLDQTVAAQVTGRADNPRFVAMQEGRVEILGPDGRGWDIRIMPDALPYVELTGPISADGDGQMQQPFRAEDDFAVARGTAVIELNLPAVERRYGLATEPDPQPVIEVDLPLPISRDRSAFEEVLIDDFSDHPLANLPVTLRMQVQDVVGQQSEPRFDEVILPGKRFFEPVAKALIEQRRDLLWARANAPDVALRLRTVAYEPDDIITNGENAAMLSFIIAELEAALDDDLTAAERDQIAAMLWDLALTLEEGSLDDARERLQRAQERLAEAMRNGASDAEIQRLMDELRAATENYLDLLAQEVEPEERTDQPDNDQETTSVTDEEIQALMDRIQELMEEGRMAEAAELMQQLNELLENLQMSEGEGGEGRRNPGEQSLDDIGETLREQQDLADDAFRELQEQFNPGQDLGQQQQGQQGQQGQMDGQQGQQQGMTGDGDGSENPDGQPGEQSLAERQQALREMLEEQQRALPGLTGEQAESAREALEQAERAMEQAEEALREGNLRSAIDRQAQALNALREGLRDLGAALADNNTADDLAGEGENQGEAADRSAQRDPLGRELGNAGRGGSEGDVLGDQDLAQRAEELLGEIQRRSSELDRPDQELEYLRRLLDLF